MNRISIAELNNIRNLEEIYIYAWDNTGVNSNIN